MTPYDPESDWWLMVGYPDPDDPVAVAEWEAANGKKTNPFANVP